MLDLNWERSIPAYNLKMDEIKLIFSEFDKNILIYDYNIIKLGCRNSNFIVSTNGGKYLLRIVSSNEFNNEAASYEILKWNINIPILYYHTKISKYYIFIYEYIEGISLQNEIINNNGCNNSIIYQVAKSAALLHSIDTKTLKDIKELDVPPFYTWYGYFLSNTKVKERLGDELHKRTRLFVSDMSNLLTEIDRYHAFIHSDFRPANMLLDVSGNIFIVDWESACSGHILADIGQFFRYKFLFSNEGINEFENTYNQFSKRTLPDNWYQLSALRDLVNPLQMLTTDREIPSMQSDLINVIISILEIFHY